MDKKDGEQKMEFKTEENNWIIGLLSKRPKFVG